MTIHKIIPYILKRLDIQLNKTANKFQRKSSLFLILIILYFFSVVTADLPAIPTAKTFSTTSEILLISKEKQTRDTITELR